MHFLQNDNISIHYPTHQPVITYIEHGL